MTQPTQKTIGLVRVDARGRVYFKRLGAVIPPGSMYLVDVEEFPETPDAPHTANAGDTADTPQSPSAPSTAPRLIQMRLVEDAK